MLGPLATSQRLDSRSLFSFYVLLAMEQEDADVYYSKTYLTVQCRHCMYPKGIHLQNTTKLESGGRIA